MNDFCVDIGFRSLNKKGEQLCGDCIGTARDDEDNLIMVLADGLGSGVKASILSTLTSKILSTMIAAGMDINDCVETIAATLPVCNVRGVAYSTFTIIRVCNNKTAEVIQYDNPHVILLRKGKHYEFPSIVKHINDKDIYCANVALEEGDIFIAMSDGAIHAGVGKSLNHGWERPNIIGFMETLYDVGFTAKTLTTVLLDECNRLYENEPGDDTTVCTLQIKKRMPLNLMIGPPENPDDCEKMMMLFFSKEGKHIVCGGTTSSIAAKYLGHRVVPTLEFIDPEIPPIAKVDGIDLVTEGVITISRVLEYARNHSEENEAYRDWSYRKDGASLIARLLLEEATDIHFFVGRARNPAHQNPNLPINFNIKMQLVEELSICLNKIGKRIEVSYF